MFNPISAVAKPGTLGKCLPLEMVLGRDSMGSSLSQQMCCVTCERCRTREANEETSETKPILPSSGEAPLVIDTHPVTPVLKVPRPGSKDIQSLSQTRRTPAHALEENMETCSAADPMGRDEGWEAAWNPMDFFVAPADEEVEAGVKALTQGEHQQEKEGDPEEKIQPVALVPEPQPVGGTARGEEQPKDQAEPGSEGALRAGITHLERNILLEIGSEAAPGQGCETEPPADTGGVLMGRDLFLCAGQVAEGAEHVEGMDRAKPAEISPQSAQAELTCLIETLTVQNPSEGAAGAVAGLFSTSAVAWAPLCPERASPEPPNQLLDFLKQESQPDVPPAQGMESLHRAEPAGLGELSAQPSLGVLWELGDEGSREWDAGTAGGEAEQQTSELPEEPETCVPAELPNVPFLLPEALGSSGEIEDESGEA